MPYPFGDPRVAAVFEAYPEIVRADLLGLRALIFETASEIDGVGPLAETLKWGQPSYAPSRPRVGSAVRLGVLPNRPDGYALFFHCQTTLAGTFRDLYGDRLDVDGARALVFAHGDPPPRDALKHCISLALTYHARNRRAGAKQAAR